MFVHVLPGIDTQHIPILFHGNVENIRDKVFRKNILENLLAGIIEILVWDKEKIIKEIRKHRMVYVEAIKFGMSAFKNSECGK